METEVFSPVALEADPVPLASDGNGIFEPGEAVEVAPAWRNDGLFAQSVTGEASGFTGPPGPDYNLLSDIADYGKVDPGAVASCREATEVCYGMEVGPIGVERPVLHWDATFDQALRDGSATTWALHIGDSFGDVPRTHSFYAFVETALHHGLAVNCGGGNFCPTLPETREMMAMTVLRALEGSEFTPDPCVEGEEVFADVPFDSPFCPWIEELFDRGVVAGCGSGNYCPGQPITRGQCAVFQSRTFGLALYGP